MVTRAGTRGGPDPPEAPAAGLPPRLRPPAVRPGATVGIFAPASPVRPEFLEAGEAELRRLGFEPRRSPNLLKRADYTAGAPEERASDFRALLEDDEVAALFAARGGYGSLDLLPLVEPSLLRRSPKAVLGASDATALLAWARRAGVTGFYGPMVAQQIARGEDAFDAGELLGSLAAVEPGFRLPWRGARFLHPGAAEGVLAGGCLSLVASLAGTAFEVRFDGAVALFEDLAVKPYQLERMLRQLDLAGALRGVRGIVFGQMPGCVQHPDQGYELPDLLRRLTERFEVPVVFGFAAGHTDKAAPDPEARKCRTVPLGVPARLDEDGLTLLEAAVT